MKRNEQNTVTVSTVYPAYKREKLKKTLSEGLRANFWQNHVASFLLDLRRYDLLSLFLGIYKDPKS